MEKRCKLPQRQGVRPKIPAGLCGWGLCLQTPALLLSLIDINLSK